MTIATYFDIVVGPVVCDEVKLGTRNKQLQLLLGKVNPARSEKYREFVEPLRMIVGAGEFEVINLALVFYEDDMPFKFVLDDDVPRWLVQNFLPEIKNNLVGTAGLIKLCSCDLKLLTKGESISLLEKMKLSKFRINPSIVDRLINEI